MTTFLPLEPHASQPDPLPADLPTPPPAEWMGQALWHVAAGKPEEEGEEEAHS